VKIELTVLKIELAIELNTLGDLLFSVAAAVEVVPGGALVALVALVAMDVLVDAGVNRDAGDWGGVAVVVLACDEVEDSGGVAPGVVARSVGVVGGVGREFISVYEPSQVMSGDIDVNVRNAVTDSSPYIGNLKMRRPLFCCGEANKGVRQRSQELKRCGRSVQ
jgi:hypothetical protein